MEEIRQLQLNIINKVTELLDPVRLRRMYAIAISSDEHYETKVAPIDVFQEGETFIRYDVSKEDIFAEQDKPALFKVEHEALVQDLTWQHSSEELLTYLD